MFSEEVNVVFGLDPSGLFEKIILAPGIGTPRTLLFGRGSGGISGFDLPGFGLFGKGGAFFLVVFGTLIFGIVIVNWPIAGTVRNEATAIAAISIRDDDLVM